MIDIHADFSQYKSEEAARLKQMLVELGPNLVWRPIYINGEEVCCGIGFDEDGPHDTLEFIDFQNKRVVDFGCNVGHFTFWAARKGAQSCLGLDSDEGVIEAARLIASTLDIKSVEFDVVNFLEEPLPRQFDVGLLIDFIGKATITKGRLQSVLRALNSAVRDEAVVTVRPRYRLENDLGLSENDAQRLGLSPFVHDGWFHLLECLEAWLPEWHFELATKSDCLNRKFKYSLYLKRI